MLPNHLGQNPIKPELNFAAWEQTFISQGWSLGVNRAVGRILVGNFFTEMTSTLEILQPGLQRIPDLSITAALHLSERAKTGSIYLIRILTFLQYCCSAFWGCNNTKSCLHSNKVKVSFLNVWFHSEKENLTPWQHTVIPPSNILSKSALLDLGIIIKKKRDINKFAFMFCSVLFYIYIYIYSQTLLPPPYLLAKYICTDSHNILPANPPALLPSVTSLPRVKLN